MKANHPDGSRAGRLTAIVHRPSPHLQACELTYLFPQGIDLSRAARQHQFYREMLRSYGLQVVVLEANVDRWGFK